MVLDLVLRWMHIISAIVLVGGTLFMRLAYLPSDESEEISRHNASVRSRWSKLVVAASGLLLVSGLINLARILVRYEIPNDAFPGNVYHMVFGIKFLLAFAVFFLSAALAGRRSLAERLREREKMWLTVNAVLAVAVVCLAGTMKLADRTPKAENSAVPNGGAPRIASRNGVKGSNRVNLVKSAHRVNSTKQWATSWIDESRRN